MSSSSKHRFWMYSTTWASPPRWRSSLVGDGAVKHVKVTDPVGQSGLEIAVAHGQLVEVAEHGQVLFLLSWAGAAPHMGGDKTPRIAFIIPAPLGKGKDKRGIP